MVFVEWNSRSPVASTKAPNFMYNEKVTWSTASPASQWVYSPVKYWPNGTDAANADNSPSNTATEANAQYLSFFAYAPYVEVSSEDYATSNAYVGGDLPAGVTAAVFTTGSAPTAVQNGIVAMSKNNETKDMYVKYILNPSAANKIVDLAWGVRGSLSYKETDNTNNTVAELGSSYNVDLTKQNVDEKVSFLFKHALARVGGSTSSTTAGGSSQICGLWAVVDVDKNSSAPGEGQSNQTSYFASDFNAAKTLVTIEEVKIRDAYTYTVTEDGGGTITDEESDFLTDGWFDIMNGKWYGTTTTKTHTTSGKGATYSVTAKKTPSGGEYNLNTQIKEGTVSNSTGADWNTTNSGGAEGVDLTKKKVYADEDVPGLLLIPGETGDNTLYITVKYIVRTADSKLANGFSEVTQIITNKVKLANSILDPNKYYNLVMHLGLTSVKFEAVVANWSNGDGKYNEDGTEVTPGTGNDHSVWLPSNVVKETVAAHAIGATAATENVNLTGLAGSTLTVVSVDGTVVSSAASVTGLTVTSGNATVQIAYTANTGTTKRDVNVVLSDGTKTITIPLSQAAGALTATKSATFTNVASTGITPAEALLTSLLDAGSTDVLASATLTCAADWIHITGTDVSVDTNDGAARNADVTITVNDATTTVNINQLATP